jgi:flagellar hook-basal body complex protein FliE
MIDFKPQYLPPVDMLAMKLTNPRHIDNAGLTGFSGSFDHGGIINDFRRQGQGSEIAELGTKIGSAALIHDGALGAAGLNRPDNSSFSEVMLKAIDKVSDYQTRVSDLETAAMTDPSSIDAHDLTVAQAEAGLSLNTARTILSRLTQAWRDIINTR